MRVVVMGAGGTGGLFGGLLARAGEDVTFVARGAHLAAIRQAGLRVRSRLFGDFTVPARATDAPETAGPADLVLFCVKAYDTETAAERLRPCVGPATAILSMQNGIDNEARIAKILGDRAVMGALALVSSALVAPGVVVQSGGLGKILFGERDGREDPRSARLLAAFDRAGIPAERRADIEVALWEKFVFICAMSGVTALTRLPLGPILATPETRALYRGVMVEAEQVGRAGGVALPADLTERLLAASDRLEPWLRGSLAHDLDAGRRLELGSLNGAVVRIGRERVVETPWNEAIHAALRPYADGMPALPSPP